MPRTKIVATVGPATQEPVVLEKLIEAGASVVRLNFSHGEHEGHLQVIRSVREIAARLDRPIAILQDLSGPKIRIGKLKKNTPVELRDGGRVTITTDSSIEGTANLIATNYNALPGDVKSGDRIFLDDGNLELRVLKSGGGAVECEVIRGGTLKSHKGVNLPGVNLSIVTPTEKDRDDLAFGLKHGVDYVAVSFVRAPGDIASVKALIEAYGKNVPVIAKIEKREAVERLEPVLEAADGVMVARGDLGIELGAEEVPISQKQIIAMANRAGKVVITATQMLESMIDKVRPTRAEASDVANAILDGTDAVMLSGESAVGRFPVEAVKTMARIADFTERHNGWARLDSHASQASGDPYSLVSRSLARVAATVASDLGCKLIVAFTETGSTAQLASGRRPRVPVAAITPDEDVYRRLALFWGVVPVKSGVMGSTDEMIAKGEALLKQRGLTASGDRILMLAADLAKTTSMLQIRTIA